MTTHRVEPTSWIVPTRRQWLKATTMACAGTALGLTAEAPSPLLKQDERPIAMAPNTKIRPTA